MGFYSKLLDAVRGINNSSSQTPMYGYVFGSIISGTYMNYKKDAHPTILCFGSYVSKNGKQLVHGIQLHNLDSNNLEWLLGILKTIKAQGIAMDPKKLFLYIKSNNPYIIKVAYRTYIAEFSRFKIVNPGISKIIPAYCYPPDDVRDGFLKELSIKEPVIVNILPEDSNLRNNIMNAINTFKVW